MFLLSSNINIETQYCLSLCVGVHQTFEAGCTLNPNVQLVVPIKKHLSSNKLYLKTCVVVVLYQINIHTFGASYNESLLKFNRIVPCQTYYIEGWVAVS